VAFPQLEIGALQDLNVSFGGSSSFVAKFAVSSGANGSVAVGRLKAVDIYVAKVRGI